MRFLDLKEGALAAQRLLFFTKERFGPGAAWLRRLALGPLVQLPARAFHLLNVLTPSGLSGRIRFGPPLRQLTMFGVGRLLCTRTPSLPGALLAFIPLAARSRSSARTVSGAPALPPTMADFVATTMRASSRAEASPSDVLYIFVWYLNSFWNSILGWSSGAPSSACGAAVVCKRRSVSEFLTSRRASSVVFCPLPLCALVVSQSPSWRFDE